MSEHSGNDTKTRLLEAAMQIFSVKGFKASTVREICQEADVNIAAVNYHFGDKDQLYGVVLREMFSHYDQSKDQELGALAADESLPAEERLLAHITAGVIQTYEKSACQENHLCVAKLNAGCSPFSLFLMEMAHPSHHLDTVVELYIKPDAMELYDILGQFFGPDAPQALIKQCADSIWGQILHRAMCAPIEDRLHANEATEMDLHALAEHIYAFTLGGLERIKQQLESQ